MNEIQDEIEKLLYKKGIIQKQIILYTYFKKKMKEINPNKIEKNIKKFNKSTENMKENMAIVYENHNNNLKQNEYMDSE